YRVYRIYQFLSVRQTGEGADRGACRLCGDAGRPRRGISGGGVLPVVRTRQPLGRGQLQDALRGPVHGINEPTGVDVNPAGGLFPDRYRDNPCGMAAAQLAANVAADLVVDADNRGAARLLARG